MHRIAVFCDVGDPVARLLLGGLLAAVSERTDSRVVAVCPAGRLSLAAQFRGWAGVGILRMFQRAVDPGLPCHRWGPAPVGLGGVARRTGAAIIIPEWTPSGMEELSRRLAALEPSAGINLYTPRKFPPGLLAVLGSMINFHNGELPRYRGFKATHWSVYFREQTSGWTVHHMTDELDAGNVLAAGAVPIGERSGMAALEHAKAEQAVAQLPYWLDRWLSGDPGVPQVGKSRLFRRVDYEAITRVDSPQELTSDEWLWRIRCFARVRAHVDGVQLPVTRLTPVPNLRRGMIGWRCANGVCLRVVTADFMPIGVYRPGRLLDGK